MATMVKEKRREKKKTKVKHESQSNIEEQPSVSKQLEVEKQIISKEKIEENVSDQQSKVPVEQVIINEDITSKEPCETNEKLGEVPLNPTIQEVTSNLKTGETPFELYQSLSQVSSSTAQHITQILETKENKTKEEIQTKTKIESKTNEYQNLNARLERIAVPSLDKNVDITTLESKLENPAAYLKSENTIEIISIDNKQDVKSTVSEGIVENVVPSAPVFDEVVEAKECPKEPDIVKMLPPKVKCMPLEEAIRVFGGKEIAEVRAMSEREEVIVEAGPQSGPEHPLVDLLTTFRSSLIAVERERTQLARGFNEEEKFRNTLWKIEKRNISLFENCPCGATVELKATYEHAELLNDRLPIAKMKLEGLLRDVQDSYCHHQHSALLAHCQIEQQISEIIKSNKNEIREALSLILQALRMSDTAPPALATALQRWAKVLSNALLDGRDLRQLLFLLHHLFRQSRSVRWASRVVRFPGMTTGDRVAAAQVIALLDLLLDRRALDTAKECVEDPSEEEWEEVTAGGGGAVGGALRERDLLPLLTALPLPQLIATLTMFTRNDITQTRENEWADHSYGRGVLHSCCGVRAFLHVMAAAVTSHASYEQLTAELRGLSAHALHALAGLYLHTRDTYTKELEDKITSELEAAFAAGYNILAPNYLDQLPATLLRDDAAREYCFALMAGVHENTSNLVDWLPTQPMLPCTARVRAVTAAAVDRHYDNDLAHMVLQFLCQTGIRRVPTVCPSGCAHAARTLLPKLLRAHPYLHAVALRLVADLHLMEPLQPSSIDVLSIETWRPTGTEVRAVLDDWASRCSVLLQRLLLRMDYTPHTGLSLETQLSIGSWLCEHVRDAPPPDWAWSVLKRLRLHASCWGVAYDAPPPHSEPTDVFSIAFAILSSSWGHSIPVICHEGIQGLCTLARARPPIAVHCLKSVMLAMAHSPDSISFTPGFTELMTTLLKCGPTVMQRALGVGPAAGADLLMRAVLQQIHEQHQGISRSAILSSWFHALWGCGAYALLDATMLAARDWQLFDSHVALMLQQSTKPSDTVTSIVAASSSAPLLCECVLRAQHVAHVRGGVSGGVLSMLQLQRLAGERIHVDNAIKKMGLKMSSEELVIYQCSTAVLSAPLHHPAHLLLWRLLLYLYLQRPPNCVQESTPPIGPLFFSGLIKSRVLSNIRKKLQETITYHEKETQSLKQKTPEQKSERTIERDSKTSSKDNNIVPELSIKDLTGESSDSDEDSQEEMEIVTDTSESETEEKHNDALFLKYHEAALIMCKDFLRWLDEGEKTRVFPHHADIARYIPEQPLKEAWRRTLSRVRPAAPPPAPPPASPPPPPPPPPPPLQATIDRILKIKHTSNHRLEIQLQSPIKDVDSYDPRALLALVDTYLSDVETLAQEWSMEVARIASLDSALWDLVKRLRVRRPLQPVKKQCPQKCKPVIIHIPYEEWCISPGAERGIHENRNSARTLIRRLARSRPHAARSSAALIAIARRARSLESALRVAERVWRSAGRSARSCALAQSTLTALVELLAERWLCSSDACVDLVRQWSGGTPLQQQLVSSLIRPWSYPPASRAHTALYAALITSPLPSHAAFSHLSKFELTRWSERADPAQRRELVDILMTAAQRWGPNPHEDHHMLLELIGVHTASIITGVELPGVIVRCARASVSGSLPPAHWTHIVAAANRHAEEVTFDQLGHVLREVGVIWWEARTGLHGVKHAALYAAYSTHIAALLHALQRAFVAAAVGLSYAPERVSVYAWSALQESWSAWLSPHATPPLLPSTGDGEMYTLMLQRFVDTVRQVIVDCPGTSPQLLHQLFEWSVQSYLSASGSVSQESRVQASALLAGLADIPWEGSWVTAQIVTTGLMVCARGDHELRQWCARTWRHAPADHWLRASVATEQGTYNPTQVLPHLLQLFTSMNHEKETLDQACQLPWQCLSEDALEEAMDRFFVQYHDPRQPYHEVPQFRVVLSASGLSPPASSNSNRSVCISRWVRAAATPALHKHVPGFCTAVLAVIAEIVPYIENSEGEIEALLGRAIVIMCEEPAANVALPVWQRWVSSTTPKLMAATLSAVCCLTAIHYFVELANLAVRVYLAQPECISWQWTHRWSSCSISCEQLCARGALYAAYAAARAHPAADLGAALRALLAASLDFVENEPIIAVWICVACRVGNEWERSERGGDGREAGVALLARCAADARRSLLKVVTMQADNNLPTPKHRLLCRLAQCIISNSDSSVQAYEAACTAVLGSKTDVLTWARTPHPRKLPRLAIRLFPNFEKYFKDELEFTPED